MDNKMSNMTEVVNTKQENKIIKEDYGGGDNNGLK